MIYVACNIAQSTIRCGKFHFFIVNRARFTSFKYLRWCLAITKSEQFLGLRSKTFGVDYLACNINAMLVFFHSLFISNHLHRRNRYIFIGVSIA